MSLILDLIVLAVTCVFVFTAAKRGFVRALIDTIGLFVSIFVSYFLSTKLSSWLYPMFQKNSEATIAEGEIVTTFALYILIVVCFVIVFALCSWLIGKISKSINSLFSSSIIGPVNTVLGAGIGIIKAALFFIIIATFVALYIDVSNSSTAVSIQNYIDSTIVLKFIFNINPLVGA